MKKLKNLTLAFVASFLLASCVITMPAGVTADFDGNSTKTGLASGTFLFGAIPLGFNIDLSTEAAAKQSGIEEVHSVNTRIKNYFIVAIVETEVKGN